MHSWMRKSMGDGRGFLSREPESIPAHIPLISPSTLKLIKDKGDVIYNHINVQGYQESLDNILSVSGIGEDILDAFLEYQVGDNKDHMITVSLKLGCFDR